MHDPIDERLGKTGIIANPLRLQPGGGVAVRLHARTRGLVENVMKDPHMVTLLYRIEHGCISRLQ